jgi:hypothetical protein
MAKGKRSNSPKRSRRGGKRSPKKSKGGVHKKISKNESEPAQLHEPKEIEEPDCECDLENETEEPQKLPKMDEEVPVTDVSTVKADLVQFYWESIEEDAHAGLKSLSQREEQFFFFGTVVAELAKSGKFTAEVESNLAMVWKADEAWIRSLLAGEVEPAKPEEPEAPMENVETVEAETIEVAEADVELEDPKPEAEVVAEVAAEAPVEAPVPEVATDLPEVVEPIEVFEEKPMNEDVAMEDLVQMTAEPAEIAVPDAMQDLVSAINKENPAQEIAAKMVSSKLGEESIDNAFEGLAPKDLNVVA